MHMWGDIYDIVHHAHHEVLPEMQVLLGRIQDI